MVVRVIVMWLIIIVSRNYKNNESKVGNSSNSSNDKNE